jgi:hypothetical protein
MTVYCSVTRLQCTVLRDFSRDRWRKRVDYLTIMGKHYYPGQGFQDHTTLNGIETICEGLDVFFFL